MTDEKSMGLGPNGAPDEGDLEAALAMAELRPSDDARDMISSELAHVLSRESDVALVLSGDMSRALAELPFADGVPEAAWCVSDATALAQIHQLFRLGGAAGAVTNTAGCTDVELAAAGLAHCEDAAVEGATRAALSCSPRYVLGRVRGFAAEAGAAAGAATDVRAALAREASRLEEAGVHGFVAEGGRAEDVAVALRAIRDVSGRPVVATMPVAGPDAERMSAPEGDAEVESRLRAALAELADAGATALGVEVGLSHLAEVLPRLSLLSEGEGLALCVTLVADGSADADADADDAPARTGLRRARATDLARARELEAAAAALTAAGVRTVSLGRGFAPGDTARLVQSLRPHFAVLGWRFVA